MSPQANTLWYGDNLKVLWQIGGESVDPVYLRPPFKSDADYVLLKMPNGQGTPTQIRAFADT